MDSGRGLSAHDRVIQVLAEIAYHPHQWTAARLAERFGVSERTIRRDLRALEKAGYRIESEDRGGYFIPVDRRWIPGELSAEEQLALRVVPFLLDASLNPPVHLYLNAYRSALTKLAAKAGLHFDLDVSHVAQWILSEPQQERPSQRSDVLTAILQAMMRRQTIQMVYHSFHSDTLRERMVDPYYLIPRQNSLYLFGFCHLREAYRIFKVSRIASLRPTRHTFVVEDDFDLARALETAWTIDTSGEPIEAQLAFDPALRRYVEEELEGKPVLCTSDLADGRWLVKVRARMNPEFERWLLQFGPGVEAVSPPELRQRIAERTAKLWDMYAPSSG
ncbi:MAG: transcriptional regulator [Alicyclobacillus sp.]|nr:transcriptional regulator [Alicyclobacillus sp.]